MSVQAMNNHTAASLGWSSSSEGEVAMPAPVKRGLMEAKAGLEEGQYCRQSSCDSISNSSGSRSGAVTPPGESVSVPTQAEPQSPVPSVSSFRSAHSSSSTARPRAGQHSTFFNARGAQSRGKGRSTRNEVCVVATPWYPDGVIKESVTLGGEVSALGQLMSLTSREQSLRHSMRSVLQENATIYWPEATVKVYGGFAYDCSLPDSALDLVCEDCQSLESFESFVLMIAYRAHLSLEQVFCCAVGNEKQAFAKFKDVAQGVTANVTFFQNRSPVRAVASQVRRHLERNHAARDVLTAVRLVMKQGGVADPTTGGLSAYALLMMVLHACQHTANTSDPGQLLVDFFALYSAPFNTIIQPTSAQAVPKPTTGDVPQVWINDVSGDPSVNVAAECTRAADINALCKSCASTLSKWTHDGGNGRNSFRGRSPLSSILAYESLWDRAEN